MGFVSFADRDLYFDQALFACKVRTHSTMKISLFYLLYRRQPHQLSDPNRVLLINVTYAGHDERIGLVQSARQEAAIVIYKPTLKAKGIRDEIVTPHSLDEIDWVLIRYEKPRSSSH